MRLYLFLLNCYKSVESLDFLSDGHYGYVILILDYAKKSLSPSKFVTNSCTNQ